MKPLNRYSAIPLFEQLADRLRHQITTGRYPHGAALPTLAEICEATGVKVDAVRDALHVLEHEGLITTDRGRQAVVRPRARRRPFVLPPAATVVARMPTGPERGRLGIALGVPVIEVDTGGSVELLAGDEYDLRTPGHP